MSFDILSNTLNTFIADSEYTDTIRDRFIKHLTRYDYDFLSIMLINQNITIEDYSECVIYNLSYENLELKQYSSVRLDPHEIHSIIKIHDTGIILRMPHPLILTQLLNINKSLNYIFLPFGYDCELSESLHMAGILINIKKNKAYLMDPNGNPTYFDKYYNEITPISSLVEHALDQFFSKLNTYGCKIDYVMTNKWNPKNYCINKNFDEMNIKSGHCVITTILLMHLSSLIGIEESYKLLTDLSKDELAYVIKGYTIAIYDLIGPKK